MQIESLAEQLLFTTVRIETETAAGRGAGTGFVYSYEWYDKTALFIVTNKHVVNGANVGHFLFTLSDGTRPLVGKRFDVRLENFETGCTATFADSPFVSVCRRIDSKLRDLRRADIVDRD